MSKDNKHISDEERRKGVLILILIIILLSIFVMCIIILLPKKDKNLLNDTVKSSSSNENKVNKEILEEDVSEDFIDDRDKSKVSITIKPGTLTVDGAVIVITDTNENKYKWTPIYRLQQKVDGKWQNMELKNPENMLLPSTLYDNPDGVMEQSLVWSNKYGKLETGEYRVVKESDGIEFFVEFQI